MLGHCHPSPSWHLSNIPRRTFLRWRIIHELVMNGGSQVNAPPSCIFLTECSFLRGNTHAGHAVFPVFTEKRFFLLRTCQGLIPVGSMKSQWRDRAVDDVRPGRSGLAGGSWKVSAGHLRLSERLPVVQPRIPVESKNVVKEDERGTGEDWLAGQALLFCT